MEDEKTAAEWAKELGTKAHYVAGVSAFAGWNGDEQITRSEYEQKLNEWLKRPIGNRK